MKMQNQISPRIKHVVSLAKSAGLIKTQRDLQIHILKSDGTPVSQPYISQVINGNINKVPDEFIDQLVEAFPFFNKSYLTENAGEPFDISGVKRYIKEHHNNEEIDDIDDPVELCNHINVKFDYKLDPRKVFPESDSPYFVGDKVKHADRVLELVAELKKIGMVSTDLEFTQYAGIDSKIISNIRIGINNDVSKNTLYRILKAYPKVSADWLVLGVGSMFRDEKDLYPLFENMLQELQDIKSRL